MTTLDHSLKPKATGVRRLEVMLFGGPGHIRADGAFSISIHRLTGSLSTDYVFDGTGRRPRREDDPANTLSTYGAGKKAGDEAVRTASGSNLIVRTSWGYAVYETNFLRTIVRLEKERKEPHIVDPPSACREHEYSSRAEHARTAISAEARDLARRWSLAEDVPVAEFTHQALGEAIDLEIDALPDVAAERVLGAIAHAVDAVRQLEEPVLVVVSVPRAALILPDIPVGQHDHSDRVDGTRADPIAVALMLLGQDGVDIVLDHRQLFQVLIPVLGNEDCLQLDDGQPIDQLGEGRQVFSSNRA